MSRWLARYWFTFCNQLAGVGCALGLMAVEHTNFHISSCSLPVWLQPPKNQTESGVGMKLVCQLLSAAGAHKTRRVGHKKWTSFIMALLSLILQTLTPAKCQKQSIHQQFLTPLSAFFLRIFVTRVVHPNNSAQQRWLGVVPTERTTPQSALKHKLAEKKN